MDDQDNISEDMEEKARRQLQASVNDPRLWQVRVKRGLEK
jgi:hypothetical protein